MVKLDIHPSLLLSPACNRTIAYYSMYMYVTKAYNNGNVIGSFQLWHVPVLLFNTKWAAFQLLHGKIKSWNYMLWLRWVLHLLSTIQMVRDQLWSDRWCLVLRLRFITEGIVRLRIWLGYKLGCKSGPALC
jgi:hypothetical protein